MDPVVAVWIGVAVNVGGILLLVGAHKQKIANIEKDNDAFWRRFDALEREKLAVADYRREQKELKETLIERREDLDRRLDRSDTRLDHLEARRGR